MWIVRGRGDDVHPHPMGAQVSDHGIPPPLRGADLWGVVMGEEQHPHQGESFRQGTGAPTSTGNRRYRSAIIAMSTPVSTCNHEAHSSRNGTLSRHSAAVLPATIRFTRRCDHPAETNRWYTCNLCGSYQRSPARIRNCRVYPVSST